MKKTKDFSKLNIVFFPLKYIFKIRPAALEACRIPSVPPPVLTDWEVLTSHSHAVCFLSDKMGLITIVAGLKEMTFKK